MKGADCTTSYIMIRSNTAFVLKTFLTNMREQPMVKLNVENLRNGDVFQKQKE